MVEQLLNHIHRHKLCKTTDKILLAVSGGLDSMVMLHLFRKAGFTVAVAHCNFQLRGTDSEGDEQLVRSASEGVTFHSRKFETKVYAKDHGISIQMAARDLRYRFFQDLLKENGYQYVATAHHLNDSIETAIINLVRGSGIDGLSGIPLKKNQIIRPLLFATRNMLQEYAVAHGIHWREDSSNASGDYHRNFIRHQIIPGLKEINPNLEETFKNTAERLAGTGKLADEFIGQFQQHAVHALNGEIKIDKNHLKQTPAPAVLLWELIKQHNFNFDQCLDICEDHQTGKTFSSSTHEFIIDREYFILRQKKNSTPFQRLIKKQEDLVEGMTGSLQFVQMRRVDFQLIKSSAIAQLDAGKIDYPLIWRSWKAGDSFIPFGMNTTKKLSDFLIDMKVSLPDKEKITVLESADKIIWVVGLRIHDHFRVNDKTERILSVTFQQQ